MIRRPPRSTLSSSSAASDVYKRQVSTQSTGESVLPPMAKSSLSLNHGQLVAAAVIGALSGALITSVARRAYRRLRLQRYNCQHHTSEDGTVQLMPNATVEQDSVGLVAVIKHHYLHGFGERNMHALLSNYAKDCVVHQVVDGDHAVFRGHSELQEKFRKIFEQHKQGKSKLRITHVTVERGVALCVWRSSHPDLVGSDTFVFDDDGKIAEQTFTCHASYCVMQ
eukprot:TRINITY_DN20735_c0_g1_i1.p1 TRINITY_DN20735_c0_g1~~TRINITY_DN20735_c0_g1_i1.p1  ORF type:complete len:224 (-),score=45.38 TRINITY_DN20735_c0_g1_i1:83-754(-)